MKDLKDEKDYITDQFNENGDSPWLEGWICGYTDHETEDFNEIYDELLRHLEKLRDIRKGGKVYGKTDIILSKVSSYFLAVAIGMFLGLLWAYMQ